MKTKFYRSNKHLIFAALSLAVSSLIGILVGGWPANVFIGGFFAVIMLAVCLYHYKAWNEIVNLWVIKGKKSEVEARKKAWDIDRNCGGENYGDVLFDPAYSSIPGNIYHQNKEH